MLGSDLGHKSGPNFSAETLLWEYKFLSIRRWLDSTVQKRMPLTSNNPDRHCEI